MSTEERTLYLNFISIRKTMEAYLLTNEEYLDKEELYRVEGDIAVVDQYIKDLIDPEEVPSQHPLLDYLLEHDYELDVEEMVGYITEEHFTEDDVRMFLNTCVMLETMDEKVTNQITKLFEYYTNKND